MKIALVVGCAESIWRDVAAAEQLCKFDAVYCVKKAGIHFPRAFDVWVGLHPEWMADYIKQRHAKGLPNGFTTVAPPVKEISSTHAHHEVDRRVSYLWPGMNASASSGIYGAKVALEDGFRVVLAGVPMNGDAHFERGKPWNELYAFEKGFQESLPHLRDNVRSMSGRTQEILGAPTPEWLAG